MVCNLNHDFWWAIQYRWSPTPNPQLLLWCFASAVLTCSGSTPLYAHSSAASASWSSCCLPRLRPQSPDFRSFFLPVLPSGPSSSGCEPSAFFLRLDSLPLVLMTSAICEASFGAIVCKSFTVMPSLAPKNCIAFGRLALTTDLCLGLRNVSAATMTDTVSATSVRISSRRQITDRPLDSYTVSLIWIMAAYNKFRMGVWLMVVPNHVSTVGSGYWPGPAIAQTRLTTGTYSSNHNTNNQYITKQTNKQPSKQANKQTYSQCKIPFPKSSHLYASIESPERIRRCDYIKFPTCQGRLLDFMFAVSSSASSAGPQLQALDRSVPRRTPRASSGSECSPPDLNCKR